MNNSDKRYDIPVIALRGMTILPDMVIHFDVSRKKSINAIESAMNSKNQIVFLTTQHNSDTAEPGADELYKIGTVSKIKQVIKLPSGIVRVLVEGLEKAEIEKMHDENTMFFATVYVVEDEGVYPDDYTCKAMTEKIHEYVKQYALMNKKMSKDVVKQILDMFDIDRILDRIAVDFPFNYVEKQLFLEASSIEERFQIITKLIIESCEVYKIKEDIGQKVKDRVDKNQRDYVLREQLKLVKEELGDGADNDSEIDEYDRRLNELKASKEIKEQIEKEIKRYKMMTASSSESNVLRGYIETLLDLPWDKQSKDSKNLKKSAEILEEDHYGLEDVKKRIIEFLAVRNVTKKGQSPVICLVGPPGTGKTSIAQSIARALNKKYVRICLGGVRDEAEIRGHRKTYVGAMPGRIATAFKNAQVNNPVILLDEIDKISSDYKGDTASALLEVLDTQQNKRFVDHYVEIPMDLSNALFIATANDLSTMQRPLLDRMEIIEINSYTANEKLHIAKEYLIPRQIENSGLKPKQITFTDKAVKKIISSYTREAGVRNLERKIGTVCRKAVTDELMNNGKIERLKLQIKDVNLKQYLGRERYDTDEANDEDDIGVVRGLAWTAVGGDTLQIEVNTMPGKGEFILTGQLGDVMKESARIALSYAKSYIGARIDADYFENNTIHIHIPEGAVPKDGPSAGITMATAIISALLNKKVDCHVAMTGELTLRGKVLPIGGLKEKLLAASMAGMKKVLVPVKNKRDVEEFCKEITKGLKIVYVSNMDEVLKEALVVE